MYWKMYYNLLLTQYNAIYLTIFVSHFQTASRFPRTETSQSNPKMLMAEDENLLRNWKKRKRTISELPKEANISPTVS